MSKLHTINLISNSETETLERVMCFAYSYFNKSMEVEFSDGYVKTYDMKNIDTIIIDLK